MKLRFALTILAVVGLWIFFPATTQAHPASGIVVDRAGNIYFSDLETIWKFDTHGKLTVFRNGERGRHVHELAIDEQDNFPTGVAAAGGSLYVLEVGFTLPNVSSGPRIKKIDGDGKVTILATVGAEENDAKLRQSFATRAGVAAESTLAFFYNGERVKYTLTFITVGLFLLIALIWQRRRRLRA